MSEGVQVIVKSFPNSIVDSSNATAKDGISAPGVQVNIAPSATGL